jgi:hypothetical protein
LTAELAREVGHPQVGWPAAVHERTGIQAGDHNRSRVTIKVRVSKLGTQRLAAQFRESAQRRARVAPKPQQPVSQRTPAGIARDGLASPSPAAPSPVRSIGVSI